MAALVKDEVPSSEEEVGGLLEEVELEGPMEEVVWSLLKANQDVFSDWLSVTWFDWYTLTGQTH